MSVPPPEFTGTSPVPKCHRPSPSSVQRPFDEDSVYSNQTFVRENGLESLGSGAEGFLASRPCGEPLHESMAYVIQHPREDEYMEKFLSMSHNCHFEHQGRCKVNITSNLTIAAAEQKFMDEAAYQLAQKETELAQARDDFTRANDTLTIITSDVYHLQKSREKSSIHKDNADRNVRSSQFLLELSQAIVSSVDDNKPFATLPLAEVRSRMGLTDTSVVAEMGLNDVLRVIRLLRNFGLHSNPNFIALWKRDGWSDDRTYHQFLDDCGRDPHITTGKVAKEKMGTRLISYLQIPGEDIDPIVGMGVQLEGIIEEEDDDQLLRMQKQLEEKTKIINKELLKRKRNRESS